MFSWDDWRTVVCISINGKKKRNGMTAGVSDHQNHLSRMVIRTSVQMEAAGSIDSSVKRQAPEITANTAGELIAFISCKD